MDQIELIATAGFGLEAVVARELKELGYLQQTVEDGRVTFAADEAAICRANLWLRSADRVMLKIGSFTAHDFGELFDQTNALPWAEWIPEDAQFPVRGKSVRSALHSVPDCQAIVKKAIVEKLKQTYQRNWFEETGATYSVEVSILKNQATLAIDSTGPGLHKRGYGKLTGPAPLKETLAAALVQLSYWNAERPLVDPFCGTGTIPIEAALIGRNRAPGLNRSFASESWHRVPARLWQQAREQAGDLAAGRLAFTLIGTDIDAKVLGLARDRAKRAGVEQDIHFERKVFADLTSKRKYGCAIGNPPYGYRLGDPKQAEALYKQMSDIFAGLPTWSTYILTSHPEFERLFGRRADRRRKLYNGRIECTFYQYQGPKPPRRNTGSPSNGSTGH